MKENVIRQREEEIESQAAKINNLENELENVKSEINEIKEMHQRELADLEYSLKIRYEDVIKNKLKEQRNEIEGKFSDLRKNKTNVEIRTTPERSIIKPYAKNQTESSEVHTYRNGSDINLQEFEAQIRQQCEEDFENKLTAVLREAEEIHE